MTKEEVSIRTVYRRLRELTHDLSELSFEYPQHEKEYADAGQGVYEVEMKLRNLNESCGKKS